MTSGAVNQKEKKKTKQIHAETQTTSKQNNHKSRNAGLF